MSEKMNNSPEFGKAKTQEEIDEVRKGIEDAEKFIREIEEKIQTDKNELEGLLLERDLFSEEDYPDLYKYLKRLQEDIKEDEANLEKFRKMKESFEYLLKEFQKIDKEERAMLDRVKPEQGSYYEN